uniref:Uncharacterized protein n=1 Tax=Candidatus Kentrum sp. SD TaxID=2126332 RepID=A0A451BJA6_9GAMM|nr:MAG: hypothetical protein BECKSD772F_GA0070984_100719 [Candidatus Kentron sp. SD]VFK40536.1 MAG: hypothetical protein BECKSD772E_GA0070983_100718 [Candidatus Kentron sp. SD]VFK78374.1 MAG: hypothetical protein BECKSD772D_GA0070982_101318 [Candidatus Kentron sp. SD]
MSTTFHHPAKRLLAMERRIFRGSGSDTGINGKGGRSSLGEGDHRREFRRRKAFATLSVITFTEDGAANPHHGRAFLNGDLEVATHAHG